MLTDSLYINVGTLSSHNSLYRNIAPKLDVLRESAKQKEPLPEITWDFSYIQEGKISMSALTSFLSIAYGVRKVFGQPMKLKIAPNPSIIRFLNDVNFWEILKELEIIDLPYELLKMMSDKRINPNTKILYETELPPQGLTDYELINKWKEIKRDKLFDEGLYSKIDILFIQEKYYSNKKIEFVQLITRITAELIVNSLLHGRDIAFIGLQRTPSRVTICVSDNGKGFLDSMKLNNSWVNNVKMRRNVDAIVNASLMTKHEIGLRKAIDQIIQLQGKVFISSFDCEVSWQQNSWEIAKQLFDYEDYTKILQTVEDILGENFDRSKNNLIQLTGYYKTFNSILRGSRISFEIPSYV